MNILNNKANSEVINYLRGTKDKIGVLPGKGRFNYKCHFNAVHEAINKKEKRVAMCMLINGEYPGIHFVNVNKDGEFTDNTLGNWVENYEYFLIKYIDDVDYFNIDDVFISYQKELRKKLSFFTRIMSNVEF